MHVLECYVCQQRIVDSRPVTFCDNCPRKACVSCKLKGVNSATKIREIRDSWVRAHVNDVLSDVFSGGVPYICSLLFQCLVQFLRERGRVPIFTSGVRRVVFVP